MKDGSSYHFMCQEESTRSEFGHFKVKDIISSIESHIWARFLEITPEHQQYHNRILMTIKPLMLMI